MNRFKLGCDDMNRDEAKFILRAYHLGGEDASDPQFQRALEMLKHDPELASWFAQENTIDAKLSEKFQSFPVPVELRGQLLAARKVVAPRPWWGPGRIIAVAACAVLMAALAGLLLRAPGKAQFTEFRSFVADATANLDHLDLMTKDVAEARRWLQSRSAPSHFVMPASLDGRHSIGCRVFDWNRRRVSLVCFAIEDGRVVHLFVINRSRLQNVPMGTAPQFAVTRSIATASWSNDRGAYVLATDAGEQTLRQLL